MKASDHNQRGTLDVEGLRSAFGADVVEHYAHFYSMEAEAYRRTVTDWERVRYFERI